MRIAILSDIHNQLHLLPNDKLKGSDLICIAGDLLDGFDEAGLGQQMVQWARWLKTEKPSPVAICSGNHDANTENPHWDPEEIALLDENFKPNLLPLLLSDYWMSPLETQDVATDRTTRLLETASGPIVITCLPFEYQDEDHRQLRESLYKEGHILRRKTGAPWIVLHHEPPIGGKTGGMWGNQSFLWELREWQPNYAACGHQHYVPSSPDGYFAEKIENCWVFNPGRAENPSTHRTITIDTEKETAIWFTEFGQKVLNLALG